MEVRSDDLNQPLSFFSLFIGSRAPSEDVAGSTIQIVDP